MLPLEPVTGFLLDKCIVSGKAKSRATWKRYGQDLYDFFGFVENEPLLNWKRSPRLGEVGAIEAYRDWALDVCELKPRTINHRLRTIKRFYLWCVEQGILSETPFGYVITHRPGSSGFLEHADTSGREVRTPSFMLQEVDEPITVLSKEQCKAALSVLASNPTHHLMFRLLLTTGLRSAEARSFPERYVFDPSRRADLKGKAFVRIELKPEDMVLKRNTKRSIDVPVSLMEEMYWWSVKVRPRRLRAAGGDAANPAALFLTEKGAAYSDDAIGEIFRRLTIKVGFRVHPHLLRHTYATHTLHYLRGIQWRGDPLMYLKRRLGHKSINTTTMYTHLLDELDADLLFKHDVELDGLLGWMNGKPSADP